MTNAKQRSCAARLSKCLLPFFLITGLVLFFLFGGHKFLSFSQLAENYTSLKAFVDGQLAAALLVFGAAYILTVALSLPVASLLTLAGGAILGWIAAAVIICAATIGATVVFIAARTVLNEYFIKRTTGFMAKLEAGFQKNAFSYLLALRLIPVVPFWVVNIVPALLGMRVKHYMLATFIGITPGTLIYVWVAKSFDILLSRGQIPDLSELNKPATIVPLFALGLLSLIPALWKRQRERQGIYEPDTSSDEN
tara:strand:+ start:2998 stop:3753 length:756 start_codon:yes stop_codon:yes gene_type:complete